MLIDLWKNLHSSVCSIGFYKSSITPENRIASGTGFKVGATIVTNNHVFQAPPGTNLVKISFMREDGFTECVSKVLKVEEFRSLLKRGMHKANWDYAIINADFSEYKKIPSMTISSQNEYEIGQSVIFLGFHFDQSNLALHTGVLSSQFTKFGVKYLQLDASVNQGNSGGPLINPRNGEVIGIITRKLTGFTYRFDMLGKSVDKIIGSFAKVKSKVMVGGFDLIKIVELTQLQLKALSMEVGRTANVGIGFAYEINEIRAALKNL